MLMQKVLSKGVKRLATKNLLIYAAVLLAVFFIFIWRLGSLTPGISQAESTGWSSSQSLHAIVHYPVNAPFRLAQHSLSALDLNSWFYMRLPAAVIGIVLVFCFYRLSVGLFGRLVGSLGTILFASLPLLVISARQATPEIMFFSPLILMTLYAWLQKPKTRTALAWISLLIVAGLLIYTPGLIWVVAGGFILARQRIILVLAETPKKAVAIGMVCFLALAAPLIVASVFNIDVIKQVALVPSNLTSIIEVLKNIGWMAAALIAKAPAGQSLLVGRLPLLDVLLVALLAFGAVAMYRAARSKAYSLGALIIFAILAAGLNNNLALLALGLPAAAVLISTGLRFLYVEWRSVFPSNPIPKSLAILLMTALVVAQLTYGLRYSLAAWPQSPQTRQVYVLK